MKEKQKSAQEGAISTSSEVEGLAKRIEEDFPSLLQDEDLLLSRLKSFSSEELERIFLALRKKGEESVLPLLEKLVGQEEKMDLALARSLGHWNSPRAAALLHRLASSTGSRQVVKAVRKSIFQLRSQGLKVPDIEDSSPSVYQRPQPAFPEGFLSSIDPTGTRLVWLARPQPPQGFFAFHALVSDIKGLIDFEGFEASRKKFHEYLDEFRKDITWEIVEAAPEYCHGLILEASQINQKKGEPLPEAFLKWRALLGNAPPLPLKPLIYLHLSEEDWKTRSDLLDRSASLFTLPSFHSWFLEEKEMQKYLSLWKEASESRLVLTPYQKEARVMEVYRQAVEELFDPQRRAIYRRRLEEMAYILWKTGKENEAQMALAAALGMEESGGILSLHPFLAELVKRSLTVLLEEEAKKKGKESDLLIRP